MAQLITATQVRDNAFLNDNIDLALIKDSYIEISQEEHIRPILTQDLYDEIVSEKDASTLTTVNATLLNDFIIPSLAFYVALDIIPHLAIRTTNKGLMINTAETSDPASREERLDIMKRFREQGKTMLEKMVRFIEDEDNIKDYPLYDNGSSDKITTEFKGGIII